MQRTEYILPILLIIALGFVLFLVYDDIRSDVVIAKVTDLQVQQIVSGHKNNLKTYVRYLVITDSETFVVNDNYLRFKFNNSDIFYHLKKDSTYSFKVSGIGKTLLSDYRNILKINK